MEMTKNWRTKYRVGMLVTCGFCDGEHRIEAARCYDGGLGFELSCGHRNGYCIDCDLLVMNMSIYPHIITPKCPNCSASGFVGPVAQSISLREANFLTSRGFSDIGEGTGQ